MLIPAVLGITKDCYHRLISAGKIARQQIHKGLPIHRVMYRGGGGVSSVSSNSENYGRGEGVQKLPTFCDNPLWEDSDLATISEI